ncbi:MAG: peptidoglycan-binding domain-containing protein [Scytonema sp. PMC 1070.18]|nr:peptidoglycan-binding domain-containing protein [Scytonema sp. PMC 1070.18]
MTEIALLMTGVLKTGQPSLTSLAEQLLVQLNDDVEQPAQEGLSQIVPTAQITPPEFMQMEETNHASLLASTTDSKNIHNSTAIPSHKFVEIQIASESDSGVSSRRQRGVVGKRSRYQTILARYPAYGNPYLPTLSFGTSGVAVRALQKLLLSNGYATRVDGVFGALTEATVKAFQNQRNLAVDGVVGQNTWYELTR